MFMLMTLYMFWRAPTVEGVLDGSMDPTGVMLKPRVVEVRPTSARYGRCTRGMFDLGSPCDCHCSCNVMLVTMAALTFTAVFVFFAGRVVRLVSA